MSNNCPKWLAVRRSIWLHGKEFSVSDISYLQSIKIKNTSGVESSHDLIALMKAGHVSLTDPLYGKVQLTEDDLASPEQITRAHEIAFSLQTISPVRGEKTKGLEKLAERFGVSLREVQRWNANFKEYGLAGLINKKHKRGGLGKSRIPEETEQVITDGINEHLLCRTPQSIDEAIRLIRSKCAALDVRVPSPNAIRNRISNIPRKKVLRAQKGSEHANDEMRVSRDKHNVATRPLQVVQTDHTPLDLIVVHPVTREKTGHPWVTVIIDVFTRIILGLYIGWEHPSFISLSYALDEAIHKKDKLLEKYNIENEWPAYGLMESLDTDNAGEFDCENLDYFIEVNFIEKNFRPLGEKHLGGHVERMNDTINSYVHTLPGTTFSNPAEKGDYNAEKEAVLDLEETRKLIYRWICNRYHTREHSELNGFSPIDMWNNAIANGWKPRMFHDESIFKLSLLPSVVVKNIGRHGVSLKSNHYTSPRLTHWKSLEKKGVKYRYRVHFNPNDMRWCSFKNPDGSGVTKLTCSSLRSAEAVSLKELEINKKNPKRFPEATPDIHLWHEQNKELVSNAKKKSKKQRRDLAQREDAKARLSQNRQVHVTEDNIDYQSIPDWAPKDIRVPAENKRHLDVTEDNIDYQSIPDWAVSKEDEC